MRTRPLVLLLCLLCLAGAWFFWPRSVNTRTKPSAPQAAAPAATTVRSASTAPQFSTAVSTNGAASVKTNQFAWRLSNTTKPLDQLMRDSHAILLENALIDLSQPLNLSIPKHLQSQGDPGAYIVQARGPIDAAFRAMLAQAGAEIVSYIPNDAYLVRAQAGVANGLAVNPLTQAVTPYEPYYKIQSSLLAAAVEDKILSPGMELNLGLFGDNAQQTIQAIEKLGGQILARDRSPFGPVVRVQPPRDWTALATLPGVQIVEPYHQRIHANDLSRVTVGVAADTQISSNYMDLTGKNVIVEVNDTGIDATHPDLTGRILGALANLVDTDGHGTHVAGTIAGDGTESMTLTNVSGSIIPATNGQFRGMAPLAKLLSMDLNDLDQELQEAAALTNALISNNSWNYGDAAYDLAAASYDAAVRDALPGVTGSQPVLFVFSAGNSGNGTNNGTGGNPDSILSPATAKNVITVGAIEQFRYITNLVVGRNNNTNAVWQPETDTGFQVADFSSRGNVGLNTEGTYGRFKPDVVAPGTFVVSTRSSQWNQYAYYNPTNYDYHTFTNQTANANTLNLPYGLSVKPNAIGVIITITTNRLSPTPFPTNLSIYVRHLAYPTTNTFDFVTWSNGVSIPPNSGGSIAGITSLQNNGFYFSVGNTNNFPVNFDLTTLVISTNDQGNQSQVLSNLNLSLGTNNPAPNPTGQGPYYRYETGTSMAAADVSGVLALMQDYFINTLHITPSPALLKAMLINGARPDGYPVQVTNTMNFEGWGLVSLPNSLPPGITMDVNNGSGEAMLILDQSPTNALATGDSHTYEIDIPDGSDQQLLPLQVTLAWTDPPGDPVAAIKLVNSLELVVSNADTGEVFYGNDSSGMATNFVDAINNVQNVFISQELLATRYFVTVIGRSVNVNAVTAHTNNVVQDYALVISCGDVVNGEVTNAFTAVDKPIISTPTSDQQITYVVTTNAPLLNQFVGASTPLLGTNQIQLTGGSTELNGIQLSPTNVLVTLGMTNQWHFYVVTNTGAADFTNAAFITFIPDTLSIPRMGVYQDSMDNATRPEADIDLYVAGPNVPNAAGLMNLNPVVISNADKSVGRGGTEFVYYTNSAPGKVYYIGVYSEDQEASEYGFIPIFTDIPFSQPGPNGSQIVNGLNLPVPIPDGSPRYPGLSYVFALAIDPMQVKRVVVNDSIFHGNFGDLIGTLTHSQQTGLGKRDVLNNHDSLYNTPGIYTNIYDDSNQGDIAGAQPSRGPGSLNNFLGQQAVGPWILTEVDDAPKHTGTNLFFSLMIYPHNGKNGATTYENTPPCTMSQTDFIDVPPGATNLTLLVTNLTAPGPEPISLYVKLGTWPTTNNFDEVTNLTPPVTNGMISIGPPIVPGRYFYGVYAPCSDTASQSNSVTATYYMGAVPGQVIFNSSGAAPILDDAVMTNSIVVTAPGVFSSVDVALRVDHPRISDLVFHLISPAGTRVLLVENRGGTDTNGMGTTLAITNIVPVTSSGGPSPTTNVVGTVSTNGTLMVEYNFYQAPDEMVVYDQTNHLIFDSGLIPGSGIFNIAYTNSSFLTIVMNPNGDPDYPNTLWDYTVTAAQVKYTYLVLTENTNLTTTPIKFAPVPFQGALTNLVSTNQVSVAISVEVTNTVVVTNTWVATNAVITGGTIMSDGFENAADAEGYVAGSIVSGWTVMSGDVDVFNPSVGHLATADTGTNHLDLNGFGPGAIATNFTTVVGQQYLLSFAYTKNPSTENPGYPYFIASANIDITGQPTLELDTPATMRNSYDDLNWQHAAIAFTATSTTTTLQFSSLNSGSGGMFLDTVKVTECAAFNGFEGAAAGDYVAGVNPNCDHWTVLSNQVTVISNATLANPAGAKLLALADGTISRTLPTVPGRTYTLSCAYRGPGAVSLWRGESNTVDSIGGNNGLLQGDLSYTNGEVNSAFNMRNSGYVFVHASPSLDVGPGPGFTIDAWVDPANISVPNPIVEWSQADGVYSGQQFFVTSTPQNVVPGSLFAGFVESNNVYLGDSFVSGANAVTNNGFQHVALTYNHATGDAAMYVNGAMVASKHINVVVPWTTGNVLIGRRINVNDGSQNFHFAGQEDEVSIYNRDLSASEIKAIYQKGGSGKYDTNAPSPAQGLAETQITVGSTAFPLFYGNNTNWQTTNFTFPATQSNMVLQITGLEPGMLLDNLALLQSAVTNFTYLTNTVVSTNTATNGFEGAVAGDYPQGQIFDGWVETGNQVTVITDPTLAVEGTNLLALADGTVTRVLPTLPGQTYTLTYAYRGPGAVALWRGETNVVDSISGNNGVANDIDYTDGQVGKAFVFNGTSSYIEVPASPSLDVGTSSSGFTLDTWVNWAAPAYLADLFEWNTGSGSGDAPVGLAFTIGPYNGTGDPNSGEGDLTANLEDTTTAFHTISTLVNLITVGSFQHVALTYDRISGNAVIYRNGVVEATANLGSSFTTQTTFPLYLGWRAAGSFASPAFNALQGALDEPTVYNRPLSASEIQAIYQKGGSGKFDPAAPTIAQGLAEAQVGVDGFYYPVFFGSNTNWLTNSITFTTSATQSNSVLQITGLEPGMLLDNFVLQQQVIVITDVVTTNLNGGDIFYLPEQSLDTLAGENAYGQWQLEVWDNRAGAYDTNLCQLINWQLRFNFATPINPIGSLTNGTTQTNIIAVGSIQYITVTVPTNADIATNILLFATNSSGTFTPLNIWFNQTTPPSGTNSPGDFLLISGTNGTSILYTNGVPPLVPGSTYYIGIQNTNGIPIDYGFRVDFHYLPVAIVLNGGQPQTNSVPTNSIVYYVVHVPTNADWATNLLLSASGPVNVWYNPTNLPVPANPPDTLLFGNATNGIAIFGTNTVPTLVPGTNYYLAVQNPGATSVTFGIEVDFHLVFSLPAGGIVFYPFTVPTNADFATNILPYASGPVNLWYDTNNPPTTNILLLPDATYPGGTNGSVVLSAGTTPPLVPGSTYWLGVQNTNSFPVIYDAPEVFFHLMPPPSITGPTITYTNIAGTNGFLLQWQGPTNFQYEIQWKTNLLPEFAWHTVVNPVINEIVTATNGHFSWFDDGTQTGGFGRMKFYRILGGQNLGPISGPGPVTNTVLAGSMSQAVVTVPANAISASNVLLSATGPLNVWFNQTNPPTGNTGAGDFLMLSASTAGTFVLTSNSVPPLVPGTNYYLGFQNPGTSNVLFVFQVAFGYAPTSAVSGFSITRTNGGIWLKWNGLTNYQYQVQWKTNLMPEVPWNTISNIVLTSTTGLFTFFDDGSLTGGFGPTKFYRLIVWPFMTPIPQTLSISSVTITNIAGTNDLVLTWSAPTNYQYGIKWTTNVALPFSSWSLITSPPPALANGIYTFIDNGLTGPPSAAKFFRLYEY